MSEEHLSSPSQSLIGRYNAQVHGSGLATVNVYETIAPRPVEPGVIAAATQKLSTLPLDSLPEPAMSALSPASRLPAFARNNKFVGRENELAHIASILKARDLATVAVIGIGGIGKSQLASEFVYRYGQYFAGGVFWLSFANADTVLAEVAECTIALGQELRLDVRTLPVEEQVYLVLSSWQNPFPRLLVFDNCEDEALLARWRPRIGGCRILITGRRAVWHPDLDVLVVPLDALPPEKSVELLGMYRSDLSVPDREQIAQELGNLPLALSLAGSYLREYEGGPLGVPSHYLTAQRRVSPLEHKSLQQEGTTYTTGHTEHVARTFALSYERLHPSETIDATALQLLARVAYFAPGEPIPRDLLRMTMGPEEDEEDEDRFVKALKRVHALGLLTPQREGAQQMHRLLVTFVQQRLLSTGGATEALTAVEEAVLRRALEVNAAGYPAPLLRLQEHLRTVTTRASERGDAMAADLNAAFSEHLSMIGAYQEAQGYIEWALSIREKSLGSEHPDVALPINNLANLYAEQGKYAEAEQLYQRALRIWEQSLGPVHPDVAYPLSGLASLYYQQGKYAEAEPLYQRAVRIREQSLGPVHPAVASPLNGLAILYAEQGKYAEAEPLYQRAVRILEQSLGPVHPQVAYPLHGLASLYADQGKYAEAEPLYQRAVRIREQSLGPVHPDVAYPLNGLASLYYQQGKYAEAEPLYQRAVRILEQSLGPVHPQVASPLNGLASLYADQGKYAEAEPLYQRAVRILEQSLGPAHPCTQTVYTNYASLLREMEPEHITKPMEKDS
ncbi:tetratricopeptide repeat protein [Ktedonobacteria bacterium brp13]|nr:tetratricopeptide repeat protein [Ktedonobacteria bacterium brp13]